jgi:cyclase
MLGIRVIPCLLLRNRGLVKTVKFKDPTYIGDPINAVKIFNEKEVDELIFLDITATNEHRKPNFDLITDIATECFMPFCYGGGIRDIETMKKLFTLGVEKIAINSYAIEYPEFIKKAARLFGDQAIVISIDVKKNMWGKYEVYTHSGTKNTKLDAVDYAKKAEVSGAGEILVTSIDRDGMMQGYDLDLLKEITNSVSIPVIANGGAGILGHFSDAVHKAHISAVAAGSMFVYYGKQKGILINYPSRKELELALK